MYENAKNSVTILRISRIQENTTISLENLEDFKNLRKCQEFTENLRDFQDFVKKLEFH